MRWGFFFVAIFFLNKIVIGSLYNPYEYKLESLKGFESNAILQNDDNNKYLGINDSNYPLKIRTIPRYFIIPNPFGKIFSVPKGAMVKLQDFLPAKIMELSDEELKKLLQKLSYIKLKVKCFNANGSISFSDSCLSKKCKKNKEIKTNAAFALLIFLSSQMENKLLARIIVLAPNFITARLNRKLAFILNVKVAAKALVFIVSEVNISNTVKIISDASNITKIHTKAYCENDGIQHSLVLSNLIFETFKIINKRNFSVKQKGILLGAILAGTLMHANKIKSEGEQKLWMINSISNLAWAATTFIGAVPIAGSIVGFTSGSLSIAVVIWAAIHNKVGSRDFSSRIREIGGYIEIAALDLIENSNKEKKLEVLELLAWIHAAIHVNGIEN